MSTTRNRLFLSDNTAGAPPEVVAAVAAAAGEQSAPYGSDRFTDSLRGRLAAVFEREVAVFPVSTGTIANSLGLAALVPPWGSVLCHPESHINLDECGAPEAFTGGAKLVGVPGADCRVDPGALREAVRRGAGDAHSVQPSALSLSQATEVGTAYSAAQVRELAGIAKEAGLAVHVDGARFANAVAHLGASPAELTWKAGVDVLSFGATKNGTMTADAIVCFDGAAAEQLAFRVKRAGQLASKMRFHSAQLDAYLADDLWLRLARRSNGTAARLAGGFKAAGIELLAEPQANILFATLPDRVRDGLLAAGFAFHHDRWAPGVARFVTSFAHTDDDIDELIATVERA
ncbi:threonine aldolase family protein [Actinokineospora bangkokensis]|uniref:L-threonine aldolase n=1 Tax=Actinokineospora bangkokensis TaxID=1193682 RepID=A0A1Q9LN77_9PSEU|nr:beta-eliminating lyase-related protein [Actinokineospora bangkokensis]OLR93480.1 low specificity L-threonine aldolase [Actinokineospora bangkokensis]